MKTNLRVLLFVVASVGTVAGCVGGLSDKAEHLEHHIPPHRPPNYAAAIFELRARITSRESAGDVAARIVADRELGEIIDWLPELAADSDLQRRPWEQVSELTVRLRGAHRQLCGASDPTERASLQAAYLSLVEELESFVLPAGQSRIHTAQELAVLRSKSIAAEMERNR